jgi:hypothetical protein
VAFCGVFYDAVNMADLHDIDEKKIGGETWEVLARIWR